MDRTNCQIWEHAYTARGVEVNSHVWFTSQWRQCQPFTWGLTGTARRTLDNRDWTLCLSGSEQHPSHCFVRPPPLNCNQKREIQTLLRDNMWLQTIGRDVIDMVYLSTTCSWTHRLPWEPEASQFVPSHKKEEELTLKLTSAWPLSCLDI